MTKSDLVHNEQMKALATLFNNLAVAAISAGSLVPVFVANTAEHPNLNYIVTFPVGVLLGLSFGALAQLVLRDLRPA